MESTEGSHLTRDLLRGAVAGLLATLPMTSVIGASRQLGILRTPAPAHITARFERRFAHRGGHQSDGFSLRWMAAHLLFGAAWGAGYPLLRYLVPRTPTGVLGVAYGAIVWAANYLGLMPVSNLYPWPDEDSPGRRNTMIVAHGVYGVSLAIAERLLPGGEPTPTPVAPSLEWGSEGLLRRF